MNKQVNNPALAGAKAPGKNGSAREQTRRSDEKTQRHRTQEMPPTREPHRDDLRDDIYCQRRDGRENRPELLHLASPFNRAIESSKHKDEPEEERTTAGNEVSAIFFTQKAVVHQRGYPRLDKRALFQE